MMISFPMDDAIVEDLLAKNCPVPTSTASLVGDALTLAETLPFLSLPELTYSQLFKTATAASTRRNHNSMLKLLSAIPHAYHHLPLPSAIILFLQDRSNQRAWKASTLLTTMSSTQGALKMLCFYKDGAPSISLGSVVWKTAMKGAGYAANAESPAQAPVLLQSHMDIMIKDHAKRKPDAVATIVELAWLLAGRVGDITQLSPKNVEWDGDLMVVLFERGKTARRGKYSIATERPSLRAQEYILQRQTEGHLWLFPHTPSFTVKNYLRSHVKVQGIECRSMRRGRLQLLSSKGFKDSELLHISRHQTIASLRRYLNFGTRSGENMRRAKKVQRALQDSNDDTMSTASSSSSNPTH